MNKNKVESFLIDLSITYSQMSADAYIIRDDDKGLTNIVVFVEDNILTLRAEMGKIDSHNAQYTNILKHLLLANAELLHGAYALDNENIILLDTLEYETMDKEEFLASLDAMGLAIINHATVIANLT